MHNKKREMPIEIKVPGSKSIANRALIINALSQNRTILENIPECDDTSYMIEGLKALKGTNQETNQEAEDSINIYTGNAGTTTRFLTALSTFSKTKVVITGDERMQKRPIEELSNALNKLGADIKTTNGCPPIEILPQQPTGGTISLPGNISSQYLSALLLTTPHFEKETVINIEQKLCSTPYVNMTIEMLNSFGLEVMNNNFEQFAIAGNQVSNPPSKYTIESDASSASYIGGFAALNPEKETTLVNIHKNSLQGDIAFLSHLETMGCKITHSEKGTTVTGPKELKALGTIDMNKTPDLVMTFAVLAMFTSGKTTIKNIENLRIKETDRIEALKNEIEKFGIDIKTSQASIEIVGNKDALHAIRDQEISIKTYNDHRIAMCFGMIRNKFPNLQIENPKCVTKSYSTFWDDLNKIEHER